METKKCRLCGKVKNVSEFYNRKDAKDGKCSECKFCDNKRRKMRYQTKKGLISKMYSHQTQKSKYRNHPLPSYSKQELMEWLFSQRKFHELYDNWKLSGFKKDLIPSCDRINNHLPYTLDNIQLVTWAFNNKRGHIDSMSGDISTGNPHRPVNQYTKDGVLINQYHSIMQAERETGVYHSKISACCKGKYGFRTAGGFVWKYK